MTQAVLNLNFAPKRMLTAREAAAHCGRPAKRFKAECPVPAVKFPNGDLRWDVRDLDAWIDQLKGSPTDTVTDEIIARLR